MNFFKNTLVAEKYKVSNSTVGEWVKGAEENKNNLQVKKVGKKYRILDNENNHAEMLRLKDHGTKYKTSRARKVVEPSQQFYKVFSYEEVIQIINDLDINSFMDQKYAYKNGGAKIWDDNYINFGGDELYSEMAESLLNESNTFLKFDAKTKFNIVDIGPGNALPVAGFLKKLNNMEILNKYIAVDISKEMLDIAKINLNKYLKPEQIVEHVVDVEYNNLTRVLYEHKYETEDVIVKNLIFILGDTMSNFYNQVRFLENIRLSIDQNDYFIFGETFDRQPRRLNLLYDYNYVSFYLWILEEMGINVKDCEVKARFDEKEMIRRRYLILDKDYELRVVHKNLNKIIRLSKGREIEIWRHTLWNLSSLVHILDLTGLEICHLTTDQEADRFIAVTRTKKSYHNSLNL